MAFQIEWSETASEDLKEIVTYIAIDDPEAATNLADHNSASIHVLRIWHASRGIPDLD